MIHEAILTEVEKRVRASHPAIILGALNQMLQELARLQEQVQSGQSCSYFVDFRPYMRLHLRLGHLRKLWNGDNEKLSDYEWDTYFSQIAENVGNVKSKIRDLRLRRYTNVCLACNACKTRRRRWPDGTTFMTLAKSDPASPLALFLVD